MAVRVRKLARQLGQSPAATLGLLHVLGYKRYRSPEDMIPDPVAGKARKAAKQGVRGKPIEPEAVRRSAPSKSAGKGADLMASLVPGVEPLDGRSRSPAPKPAPSPAPAASPTPEPAPAPPPTSTPLDGQLGEIARADERIRNAENARDLAVAERDQLAGERDAACSQRDEALVQLEAAQAEVERLRGELEAALATSQERAVEGPADGLSALFEARGLRGRDEHARALEALVRARRIDPQSLQAVEPEAVRALLDERVLLFDGEVPEQLSGVVGVGVSSDRADLPGADALGRSLDRIGEQLLLNGWKQLRAVGVPPRWHALLRHGIDPRVDLHLVPGGPRDAARAEADVQGMDVVWLWGVEGDEAAREAWARCDRLVSGPADIEGALQAMLDGLVAG